MYNYCIVKGMDISMMMVHAQQIEKGENQEEENESKRARIGRFNFS